ncbi:MAG: hypothetical protein JWQ04_3203 [Pedosphaera sp.]|nr:hypothetical protein [Pedosphaera sp.]
MKLFIVIVFSAFCLSAFAQNYDTNGVTVQTFVGSAFSGYLDGQGQQTMFNGPISVVADTYSNLFVFDYYNHAVRKVTPDGTVTSYCGGGTGSLPGYGTNVSLGLFVTMTMDRSNNLFLLGFPGEGLMVKIDTNGYASLIPLPALGGDNGSGGMCVDSLNNLYVSDSSANKIYRYKTNGVLEVFVGSGNQGAIDGNGIFTSFSTPQALTADSADNIYVWDSGNNIVRKIAQNKDVTTISGRKNIASDSDGVGTNATFFLVSSMCTDGFGNIYLACFGDSVRRISATTNVTTIAGSFNQRGYVNGIGSVARFDGGGDAGICFVGGTIFIADFSNQRIRQITFNPASQIVPASNLSIGSYPGVKITGTVGRTYQIQSSPNMSAWTTETTVLLNSTPFLWFDQSGAPKKFYRAVMLP